VSLAWTNRLLAVRIVKTTDLLVCCSNLKVELVVAQGEVTSLAEKTRGLEDGLAWVSTERCPEG
jgi:hypothetical protein